MPHQTIEDVVDEMHSRWLALKRRGDWRAVFAKTYLRTTQHLLEASRTPGYFENPAWIVQIDCDFAQRYFDAFDCFQETGICPWPWRIAFRSALDKRTFVFQDMLLGMSAHINYDLPMALNGTIPSGLSTDELAPYRRDHNRLNYVLAQAVDLVQVEIQWDHDPALGVIDLAFNEVDESTASRMISMWRERSWGNFMLLRNIDDLEEGERIIEQSAVEFALLLLQFQRVVRTLYWPNRLYRDSIHWVRRWV